MLRGESHLKRFSLDVLPSTLNPQQSTVHPHCLIPRCLIPHSHPLLLTPHPLALNPAGTPPEVLEYVLDAVDLILVMSVNPGFGGQSFIESQVEKVRKIKAMCKAKGVNPWIEVDGGVNPANAYKMIDAGANALVAGSAVFNSPDYAAAIAGIKGSKAPK